MHTLIRKRKGKGRSKGTYWSQKKRGNGREIKPTNVGAKEIRKRKGRKEAKESIGAKKREDKGIYTLALCIDGSGFVNTLLLQFRKFNHLRAFVAMQEMSRFTRFGSQKKL